MIEDKAKRRRFIAVYGILLDIPLWLLLSFFLAWFLGRDPSPEHKPPFLKAVFWIAVCTFPIAIVGGYCSGAIIWSHTKKRKSRRESAARGSIDH